MLLNENKVVSIIFDSKSECAVSKEMHIENGYRITEEIEYFSAVYQKMVYKFSAEYVLEV